MNVGDLKPKGSDMTLYEISKFCENHMCPSCELLDVCKSFIDKDLLDVEVEVMPNVKS